MRTVSDSLNPCVIAAGGEPKAKVVLNKYSRPHCKNAVRELLRGIAKSTGVRIFIDGGHRSLEPIRPAPSEIQFLLPTSPPTGLGKDGFRMHVKPSSLIFEAEHASGFDNAVYTFLEKYCGFRWLWPGKEGEVFDNLDKLAIPSGSQEEIPDYKWRHLLHVDMPYDLDNKYGIMEFHMQCSSACHAQFKEWLKRNRMGGLKTLAGHSWGRFINPDEYGQDHPEFFAQINGSRHAGIENFNGKHGAQICTSNPQVLDILVQKIRDSFDRNPELDVISISPNDGRGFCECDECVAVDVKYGNPPPQTGRKGGLGLEETFQDDADTTSGAQRITGSITDRMFEFANKIAARIAKSHPDKMLLMLVYGPYREPPKKVKLAPSVIAQFCVRCHQHWEPALRRADYDAVTNLTQMTEETGIYEYFDQGAWPGMTRFFPDLIEDSARFYNQQGVRHYSTQASTGFAANGFNLWFLSRVLWDTDAQVDSLLEEYCDKAFGPASEPMQKYFELWRQRWKECKGITHMGGKIMGKEVPGFKPKGKDKAPFEQILTLYSRDFILKAETVLSHAKESVDSLSLEHRRIDFFNKALEGTKIVIEAAEVSYKLRDEGWPLQKENEIDSETIKNLGSRQQVLNTAQGALKLWTRWEAFLESARDDFVFSFFWARYCLDACRGSHPYYKLQQIVDLLSGF